ncbi:hypothetical protein [Acinetobacter terrestris]|uniref:hypothetical protein n=1 Tax=Acinetobacter terrestris TaxID=2529843 RepID=UPI00103C59C9|nr:hypothetical protein [Acinetobacter terrestris]TCB61289.1 hypothetical protein E0H81_13145 [Acinetobacter terrestris]
MKIFGQKTVGVTKKLLSGARFSNVTMQSAIIMMSQRLCLAIIISGFITGHASAAKRKELVEPISSVFATNYDKTRTHTTPVRSPVSSFNTKRANFKQETATQASVYLADWVLDSGDNQQMPFVIVDKKEAKVYVFDALGQLTGAAPALLGLAVGDNSIPNIGTMPLASIKPEQRTTPAGRFVAALGKNIHNKEILWVDYDAAISLHRVVTSSSKERRLQRLESKNPLERRISYGCINVPVKFYDQVISPSFTGTNGIVYVLPDTRSVKEVFGSYSVADPESEQ